MRYHATPTNPPSCWHSPRLQTLHEALCTYDGQALFAHPYRAFDTNTENSPPRIDASVLVLLTNEPQPRLLLTKRARHLSAHAGEISFVGGKRDQTDTDASITALREAYEEVGLPSKSVHIIGYLPCQTAKSGAIVRPVVGVITPSVADGLRGSDGEIERIFWGTLDYFIHQAPFEYTLRYDTPKGQTRLATPAWQLDGEIVWGLTGRIIANLLEIGFGVEYAWYYKMLTD